MELEYRTAVPQLGFLVYMFTGDPNLFISCKVAKDYCTFIFTDGGCYLTLVASFY